MPRLIRNFIFNILMFLFIIGYLIIVPQSVLGKRWELYDMQHDHTETTNLAGEKPEVVQELQSRWNRWVKKVDAAN